jgi:hypothetical protein
MNHSSTLNLSNIEITVAFFPDVVNALKYGCNNLEDLVISRLQSQDAYEEEELISFIQDRYSEQGIETDFGQIQNVIDILPMKECLTMDKETIAINTYDSEYPKYMAFNIDCQFNMNAFDVFFEHYLEEQKEEEEEEEEDCPFLQ